MDYHNLYNPNRTPQTQPIPGRTDMVRNEAGGFGWQVSDEQQLLRFLILGATGNTYYVGRPQLVRQNAEAVVRAINRDYKKAIDLIVDVSDQGRAASNDPAIFALALAASNERPEVRAYALHRVGQVCRIPTHLFAFAEAVDALRGWGRGLRDAIGSWYNGAQAPDLAFHMAKYQQRNGWSHRDLLRLSHPKPATEDHQRLYAYACGKLEDAEGLWMVEGLEAMKRAKAEAEVIRLITQYKAPREIVPTQYLKSPGVWNALLPHLGYTAMLRNLGNMGKSGLLSEGHFEVISSVSTRLSNSEAVKRSRVHPIAILKAARVYQAGRGFKGDGAWPVVGQIIAALEQAFYAAFDNVEPTGKKVYLSVDHSGSMTGGEVAGVPNLCPRDASAVMAMVAVRTEENYMLSTFGTSLRFPGLHKGMSLREAVAAVSGPPEGTDCSLPVLDALRRQIYVDAFVLYTDNMTWAGSMHPAQALNQYRRAINPKARFIVTAMVPYTGTVADPKDKLAMNVVGFDTDAPGIISAFIKGEI